MAKFIAAATESGSAPTAAEQYADRRHAGSLLEDAVHATLPEDNDVQDHLGWEEMDRWPEPLSWLFL